MAAEPIVRAKEVRDDGSVIEIVVWRLTQPLDPCAHPYKYDFQQDVENWR